VVSEIQFYARGSLPGTTGKKGTVPFLDFFMGLAFRAGCSDKANPADFRGSVNGWPARATTTLSYRFILQQTVLVADGR